jgi:uncharacterized protein (TIGR03067 family)
MRSAVSSFLVIALFSATACSRSHSGQAAPAVPIAAAKDDLDNLQGTWRVESSAWNGVADTDVMKTTTVIFQGDKFIVVDRDGNRQEETIKLSPDQNPKAIDCWSKVGGRAKPGIYALDGDTFRWCSAGSNNTSRPTTFASMPGSKHSLLVLRRGKQ